MALWPRRFGVFGECIGNAKNNFFVTVQKVQHEHGIGSGASVVLLFIDFFCCWQQMTWINFGQ
jgi:hypothetical protein